MSDAQTTARDSSPPLLLAVQNLIASVTVWPRPGLSNGLGLAEAEFTTMDDGSLLPIFRIFQRLINLETQKAKEAP